MNGAGHQSSLHGMPFSVLSALPPPVVSASFVCFWQGFLLEAVTLLTLALGLLGFQAGGFASNHQVPELTPQQSYLHPEV
jgi:hypothetical protein